MPLPSQNTGGEGFSMSSYIGAVNTSKLTFPDSGLTQLDIYFFDTEIMRIMTSMILGLRARIL